MEKQIIEVFEKITQLTSEQQKTIGSMADLLKSLTDKLLDLQNRVIKLEQMPRKIVKDKDDFPEGYPFK